MKMMKLGRAPSKQRGVTLVEVSVALGIMGSVIAGVAVLINQRMDDTKASVTAQHIKTVGTAAGEYIKENYTALLANATVTKPALIRVSDLVSGGYLQAGFNEKNPFGQATCVLALKSSSGDLTSIVATEGGMVINDLALGQIAAQVGASGGGVYSSAPTQLRGTMGGWEMAPGNYASANHLGNNCSGAGGAVQFQAGHPVMALWFADGKDVSGLLHRNAVPGRPELNTMETPFLLGSGAVQAKNDTCITPGAIAREADGKLLSCNGGKWRAAGGGLNWKGTLTGVGNLPATDNNAGDTYRIANLANHAFTWDEINNVWQGLTVEANGDLKLPGAIYANGSSSSYGSVTMLGKKNGWGGINFKDSGGGNLGTLMMGADISGFYNAADNNWRWYVDNNGTSRQDGVAYASAFKANSVVLEGGGCSPEGLIAQSANTSGAIVSCQSGVWKRNNNLSLTQVSNTCGSGHADSSCFVLCPAPKAIVSGGCHTNHRAWYVVASTPYGNGWYCQSKNDWGDSAYNAGSLTVHAMCQ